MLIGQSVLAPVAKGGGAPGATYYSPWFPRQGDVVTAIVEVMRTSGGTVTMDCQIQTKNNEDNDASIVNLGSPFSVTTTAGAVTTSTEAGALEQVRYKFTVTGDSRRWVHFRSNAPMWQPN